MPKSWWLILAVWVVASACEGEPEADEDGPSRSRIDARGRVVVTQEEQRALGLETATAVQGAITTSALRFGHVVARPDEDVLVTAPITARLQAPKVALGATVAAGDLLLGLEPLVDGAARATLEAQRRELAGQLEGARAQVDAKRADLSRVATLVASGLATEAERAQAEATLTAEQARVDSLRLASSALSRMTGGRLELRAPAPGILAALSTEAGSTIPQGTVVARIVRPGPRWIDLAVPPGDPPGTGYRARGVSRTVPVQLLSRGAVIADDGTRRDRLEAAPDVAAELPPGATVPVEVLHTTAGTVIASNALVRRGRETLIFIEVEAGRYAPRPVRVEARDDTRAVVASGLAPGDHVVTLGAGALLGELGAQGEGQGDRGPE